jgi:hypothetical protein
MPRRHRAIDLTQTLKRVSVPSAVADRNGVVTWLKDAGRRSFGDLLGRPFASVVAPQHVELVQRQLLPASGGRSK